jgi:3-dehydroquinate dehydratase-2
MTTSHNRVEVLHGVNFDMLGTRNRLIYGDFTLTELEVRIKRFATELGLVTTFFQSNAEGEFVEHLHRLPEIADAAIVNAGAWTHTRGSATRWSQRRATVEIHLSDVETSSGVLFDGLTRIARLRKPDGYRRRSRCRREVGGGRGAGRRLAALVARELDLPSSRTSSTCAT